MSKPQFGPRASFIPQQESTASWFERLAADRIMNLSLFKQIILVTLITSFIIVNFTFFRLAFILNRDKPKNGPRPSTTPTHLMVVLGSGGHTTEMLNILRQLPSLTSDYTKRTYIVSSGDGFSSSKAAEFEKEIGGTDYDIVTVTRARRVHQSILTAPFSTLQCIRECSTILSSNSPDLILTNGPGTGVCVVLASVILLFFGSGGEKRGQMRSIFIESWARVKSLSLSGKLLRPFVDRFLVQWPDLVSKGDRLEYIGPLVR